ncbi:MAG: GntR family transcriptional regulator [Thermoanaerobacteraceae bacterium]|nr:GntR family transcriptional regulator [Thermoanaerobacteraceae bacterium]
MDSIFKPIGQEIFKPVRDIVFEELRNAIFKGELKPNQRLIEEDIAKQMGISRTPVREALRMLENEGLVVHVPRKGVLVTGFSNEDIDEIYRIRGVLEGLAASLAVDHITLKELTELEVILRKMKILIDEDRFNELMDLHNRFNYVLIRASRSPRLCSMIDTMQEYLEKTRMISLSSKERQVKAHEEHEAIVNAIKSKDKLMTEKLVREHTEKAREAYFQYVKFKK